MKVIFYFESQSDGLVYEFLKNWPALQQFIFDCAVDERFQTALEFLLEIILLEVEIDLHDFLNIVQKLNETSSKFLQEIILRVDAPEFIDQEIPNLGDCDVLNEFSFLAFEQTIQVIVRILEADFF